jgi:hypothetical protein
MSNINSLEVLRLGVPGEVAGMRQTEIAAAVSGLVNEANRRGLETQEQLAEKRAYAEQVRQAMEASGVSAETHTPEVIELAVTRELTRATNNVDAAYADAQMGAGASVSQIDAYRQAAQQKNNSPTENYGLAA